MMHINCINILVEYMTGLIFGQRKTQVAYICGEKETLESQKKFVQLHGHSNWQDVGDAEN
jgi:hypothetical protein